MPSSQQSQSLATPPHVSIKASTRYETLTDFYETLVDLNAKIPNLSLGQDVGLLIACINADVSPFWVLFTPLSAYQLAALEIKMESDAVDALSSKMPDQTWDQDRQEMEYRKAAAKIGPSATPKGLERFADRAWNMVYQDAMEIDDCEMAVSGLVL